jgi:hypothetical protein
MVTQEVSLPMKLTMKRTGGFFLSIGLGLILLGGIFYYYPLVVHSPPVSGSVVERPRCVRLGVEPPSAEMNMIVDASGGDLIVGITTIEECKRWEEQGSHESLSVMDDLHVGSHIEFKFVVKGMGDYGVVIDKMAGESNAVGFTLTCEHVTYPNRETGAWLCQIGATIVGIVGTVIGITGRRNP